MNSLSLSMDEAFFCCSMRLSEGLWYINENKEILYAETDGDIVKSDKGIYFDGDIIYCEPDENIIDYASSIVEKDNHKLCPIIKYYRIPMEIVRKAKLQIIF